MAGQCICVTGRVDNFNRTLGGALRVILIWNACVRQTVELVEFYNYTNTEKSSEFCFSCSSERGSLIEISRL